MRIVIVSGIYPPDIGGPATHSANLLSALQARGHNVRVITLSDGIRRTDHGSSVVKFPRRWPWPVRLLAVSWWLLRQRRTYDLVYATGLHPAAVAGARLARRVSVVKIVGDPAWERAVRRGQTDEGFDAFQSSASGSASVRAMQRLRNWTVSASDAVTVPSQYLRDVVARWVPGSSMCVIHNGVSEVVAPQGRLAANHQLTLVYVGRLVGHKRVDVLVNAVAAMDGAHLHIIGDGPERDQINALIRDLDLSARVQTFGPLSHEEVLTRIAAADALVLASEYEGLPHVALEALACGVPVIAPSVGGVDEVVVDGANGLLVPSVTVDAFVSCLRRFKDDVVLRQSLTRQAGAESQRWSFAGTVDRLEDLFHRLVYGSPRAVFVGKVRLDQSPGQDVIRKFELLSSALTATFIGTGVAPRRDSVAGVRVIRCPDLSPAFLGGLLFYVLAPAIAMIAAVSRNAAIVCQSPFEAFGVVLLSRCVPRSRRPRIVIEAHGDWRTAARLYGSVARRAMAPAADVVAAWTVRRADRVRVVAKYLDVLVREAGYEGEIDRFVTFSDFSMFTEGEPAPFREAPSVCFVGAFEPYKAVDVLVDAWRQVIERMPEARLTLVGDGPLHSNITRRVGELGLDGTVQFTGSLSRPEVRDVLDRSWGLVLPSRSEGLPRIIFEAMLRGRAVVATKVGDIPEVVSHARNGYLVDPDDARALADALLLFMADHGRAALMGAEGRRGVVERDLASEYRRGIERLASWLRNS